MISNNIRSQKIETASISFYRFSRNRDRIWAFAQMGLARLAMRRLKSVGFWKLLGSGTGEGFSPKPNTSVYAVLCTWPDLRTAQEALEKERIFKRYRNRAAESWTVFLAPQSARGAWSGQTPFTVTNRASTGPLAALTRATIKPRIAMKFWRKVPGISKVIGADPNVLFKIGVGEVPWLHQITFSIWPSEASMADFARRSKPHAEAIKAVRAENWFKEELYARFEVLDQKGSWNGQNPLAAATGLTK